jgi:RHS repeat-associated protein
MEHSLRAHLGNVRLTFTTKEEVDESLATLETGNASQEQSKFLYYNEAVKINYDKFDHTNAGGTYYSTRLTGGSTGEKYGLTKTLSVMPGDKISMEVYAKYLDPDNNNWNTALTNFIGSITGGTAPAGTFVDGGSTGSIGGGTYPITGINHTGETGTAPKAYLNYIVFNKDMTTVLDMGFKRITTNSREYGQDVAHDKLAFEGAEEVLIKEPGYVYIYLSNENETSVEVFFDDFQVEHKKSPVVQMDDYYPFGLTFNSYQRENSTQNRHLYNQGTGPKTFLTERVFDLGLNIDLTRYRAYDPAIGRWWQVDPLAAAVDELRSLTPYNYSYNNPIRYSDPEGDFPFLIPIVIGAMTAGEAAVVAGGTAAVVVASTTTAEERSTMWEDAKDLGRKFVRAWSAGGGGGYSNGVMMSSLMMSKSKTKAGDGDRIKTQTKDELEKSKTTLEGRVEEHKKKLEEYKKDPEKHDNEGKLKDASPENKEKIINGRIKKLEGQINKNQGELDKVNKQLEEIKKANENSSQRNN